MSSNNRAPLFLCVAPSGLEPALSQFRSAMGGRPFDLFDKGSGGQPDFSGRRAVVDLGGWGTRQETTEAVAAGVELWHVLGYGLDHVDLEYLLRNGVTVAHTPGSCSAISLAEHAMMLMLNCARQMKEQAANLRVGEFWHPWTSELAGKRLLLLGVGASGKELATRAAAFQMEVVGVDVAIDDDGAYQKIGISSVSPPDALSDLLPTADFVSLHLPLTAETRHIIDGEALSRLKPSAIVINVARGAFNRPTGAARGVERRSTGRSWSRCLRRRGAGPQPGDRRPPSCNRHASHCRGRLRNGAKAFRARRRQPDALATRRADLAHRVAERRLSCRRAAGRRGPAHN